MLIGAKWFIAAHSMNRLMTKVHFLDLRDVHLMFQFLQLRKNLYITWACFRNASVTQKADETCKLLVLEVEVMALAWS